MAIPLNPNIAFLLDRPIVNSKASEVYVSVRFTYEDYTWEGYVPIEYRRTGTSIDFDVGIFKSCKIRTLIAENVHNSRSAPNSLQVVAVSKACSAEIKADPVS